MRHHGGVSRRVAGWLVVALFAVSVAALQTRPAHSHPPMIEVRLNGAALRVLAPATVDSVLRAAAVRPRAARLYSAQSHIVLSDEAAPPMLMVDGGFATLATPLVFGDAVTAMDGPDEVEGVVEQHMPVPWGGLPDVEDGLWYPGVPGEDTVTVGAVSGEQVSSRRTLEPVAARRERAPVVALTFDDGPDPRWTPQVLQVLAEEGVKATFCVVGFMARRHPDLVRAARDQGHVLCDHTEHHAEHLPGAPREQIVAEMGDGARSIEAAAGGRPPLYRPPGGHLGPDVVAVAHEQGLRVLRWTVDPHDYLSPPADAIAGRVLDAVRPGGVILLHDGGGDRSGTVAALRTIIQQLKTRGWAFATPMFGPPPR